MIIFIGIVSAFQVIRDSSFGGDGRACGGVLHGVVVVEAYSEMLCHGVEGM